MSIYQLGDDVPRVPGSAYVADGTAVIGKVILGEHVSVWPGAVIRGDTDHYDYVAGEAAKGIGQVTLKTGVPVIFSVLTCDTLEQAINRAGAKAGNKGFEAAVSAIEMVNLLRQLPGES